jgi:hypothetical protein
MTPGKNKSFDLRKSVRLPVPLPVKFRLFDITDREPSSTTIHGHISNISAEGLCLETNTTFIDGCNIFLICIQGTKLLQLEVKFSDISNPLRLRGNVIWYNSNPHGSTHQFSIGIYITEATERSKNLWLKYVNKHKDRWFKTWARNSPKKK